MLKVLVFQEQGGDDSATISFTGTQNSVSMATALVKQAMNVGRAKQSMKKYFREALMAFNFFKLQEELIFFQCKLTSFFSSPTNLGLISM